MKKNIIIAALAILSIVSFCSSSSMSGTASYWMKRCLAAEAVIDKVWDDNENYVLDVLCEGDAWCEWEELK